MRHVTLTALALVTVGIVACEQQAADRNPTAPDGLSYAKPVSSTCDARTTRLIGSQQSDLWAKPALDSAQLLMAAVSADCSTGQSAMLTYIQWTIDHRDVMRTGATDDALIAHWGTVFPYVGYVGNSSPEFVPTSIFGPEGKAQVIKWDVGGEIKATNAALTQSIQDGDGDQRDHLFVIYPIGENCLSGTNLQQFGRCFQFAAFPHLPTGVTFSPRNLIGICEPIHDLPDAINLHLSNPSLGHLDPVTRITDEVTVTYPDDCDHVAEAPVGSWNHGFGDAVRRLAWLAKKAVTPEPLYAVHGGLGGLGGGLSPFGAVDLEVFHATFTNDVAEQQPAAPETGSWEIVTLTSPGTILIQNSLGQQTSKLVVLNQSGGNCAKNCGGLYLRGQLDASGPAAKEGTYEAEFVALQAQSNMKEAVFALRDTADANIATVTFAVRNNRNLILYNDKKGGSQKLLGNWQQNVPVHFRIRVDLDTETTKVWVDHSADPIFEGESFVQGAKNLASIVADFRGIDSGTMGWDEIKVTRLSDPSH